MVANKTRKLTLSIQKVGDRNRVRSIGNVRCLEDLFHVSLGLDAHVLLAEGLRVLLDVGVLLHTVSIAVSTMSR
jgi:hypothetical protein